MELLVHGHAGAKVLVFPTRGGRFYEYENLRMVKVLQDKIRAGHIQLFCVDSIDSESFYCWWAHPSGRIERHKEYENYVINEVIPFMNEKNSNPCTISHGMSLGAFHAGNIAFRHPSKFQKLVALSGRFDLTLQVEYFGDLFNGYYNDDIYFNTPTHFLPSLDCPVRMQDLKDMEITLVIGEDDPFKENNKHLSQILQAKGIDHNLHFWEHRAHRGYYWRRMAPQFL
ncbi:alpha/beta hydrolase-fold protein [Puniceicoccaceae bacterium K14]|nr:alpha/beta hydrolase-fold protein [Puniceicoccaceae bacterium K14]